MDIQTQQYSIGSFFPQPVELQIPFFQRNYVWEESDWEKFWETMCGVSTTEEAHSYFMGTIALKRNSLKPMDNIREIVDGQQRLITIFLFFKAVCQKRKEEENFNKLFLPHHGQEKKLKVSLDDEKIFDKIIEDKIDEINEEGKKNKIYQCFKYFLEKDYKEIKNINLMKIMNNICFVVIELGATQDEQQIFDTLNSIGFPLSTAEIVKNYLFKGKRKKDMEDYKNYWESQFEGQRRKFWDRNVDTGRGKKHNIEVFFQAFFDLYDKETQTKKYGNRGSLANRYKILLKGKIAKGSPLRTEFLDTIKEYTEIYHENINRDLISGNIDFASPLDRINIVVHKMNNTTILPYILYILKNVNDPTEKNTMLSLIESYIVRRALCRETTNSYNSFFSSLVHGIVRENVREFYTTPKNLNNLMYKLTIEENRHSLFPSDDRLWSKLSEAKEGIKNKNAKAVLYLVEQSLFDERDATRLLPLDSYSIEHILPKKWRPHWKNFAKNISNSHEQENYVNRYVNKIGNLTILTQKLNSSISNERWEIKKNGREGKKNKGLIDCAKNIKSFDTKDWLHAKNWDANTIDSRTKYLFDEIKKIWAAPKPPQD